MRQSGRILGERPRRMGSWAPQTHVRSSAQHQLGYSKSRTALLRHCRFNHVESTIQIKGIIDQSRLNAWPSSPFQIPLPIHPDIHFYINQVRPGGTARQMRWLLAVLQDLRGRLLADLVPEVHYFSTDPTEVVFGLVTELYSALPLQFYVDARAALAEGLEILMAKVREHGGAQLEGEFAINTRSVFATLRTNFADAAPVIPQPESSLTGYYTLPGSKGLTLSIIQAEHKGDGWDAKHCYDTLNSLVSQFEHHTHSKYTEGIPFSARTTGPGDWMINYEVEAPHSILSGLVYETALLVKLRDIIMQHGMAEMDFTLCHTVAETIRAVYGRGTIKNSRQESILSS